jgi:predicted N-acyltransferase
MRHLSHQFHWQNEGYRDFDEYLSTFRSSMRKQVRRERRRANAAGLEIRVLMGDELTEAEWRALYVLYRRGCARYGSPDYLTSGFFEHAREHLGHRLVAALATQDGEVVAASFGFEKGACLYGRYWGCMEDYDSMHFELCYYRLIERAIERGMKRFEAGAQGTHKLRRGLMPAPIDSLHWIRDERLRAAVADFLPREAFMEQQRMAAYAEHGPFRRGERQ